MSTYLLLNGKQQGPYSLEQLRGLLESRTIPDDVLSWQEGMPEWRPIGSVMGGDGCQAAQQHSTPRQPGLGIASFAIACAGVIGWFILLVAAAAGSNATRSDTDPLMVAVGLAMFLGLGLNVMGAIFGIVGVTRPKAAKTLSVIGLSLNSLEMVGIVLLMLIGLAMGS